MIDEFSADTDLPSVPIDLSARMREIRARQGLKQSEIARRMGLDPSIPSLWEQGKRPVPANRIGALAEALGVSVNELLEGLPGAPHPAEVPVEAPARSAIGYATTLQGYPERELTERTPLMTLVSQPAPSIAMREPHPETALEAAQLKPRQPFVQSERPPLAGWIPDGWEPSDRVQDITPALPDGYWLDPVRLERPSAKQLLHSRLCAEDQALVGDREVPGLALAERIYQHCSKLDGFSSGRLPLIEAIFRLVLASEYGGLTVDAIVDSLKERAGVVPVTRALLRRLRDSARPYPLRWVDRELFGH